MTTSTPSPTRTIGGKTYSVVNLDTATSAPAPAPIVYSQHALARMQERGLTKALVEAVLAKPADVRFSNATNNKIASRRLANGAGSVEVVFAEMGGGQKFVVTTFVRPVEEAK